MGKRLKPLEERCIVTSVSLHPSEAAFIRREAARRGLTISEYLRQLVAQDRAQTEEEMRRMSEVS